MRDLRVDDVEGGVVVSYTGTAWGTCAGCGLPGKTSTPDGGGGVDRGSVLRWGADERVTSSVGIGRGSRVVSCVGGGDVIDSGAAAGRAVSLLSVGGGALVVDAGGISACTGCVVVFRLTCCCEGCTFSEAEAENEMGNGASHDGDAGGMSTLVGIGRGGDSRQWCDAFQSLLSGRL